MRKITRSKHPEKRRNTKWNAFGSTLAMNRQVVDTETVVYAMMCAMFLDLEHFSLFVSGDHKIRAGYQEGYKDGYTEMKEYFVLNKAVPCPLWEYRNGRRYYINYFFGNYVIPDIVD